MVSARGELPHDQEGGEDGQAGDDDKGKDGQVEIDFDLGFGKGISAHGFQATAGHDAAADTGAQDTKAGSQAGA